MAKKIRQLSMKYNIEKERKEKESLGEDVGALNFNEILITDLMWLRRRKDLAFTVKDKVRFGYAISFNSLSSHCHL